MSYGDLVSLRFFLASSADDPANVEILCAHLGDHVAARTVVVQHLLDPAWLIEIEAVAAKVELTPVLPPPAFRSLHGCGKHRFTTRGAPRDGPPTTSLPVVRALFRQPARQVDTVALGQRHAGDPENYRQIPARIDNRSFRPVGPPSGHSAGARDTIGDQMWWREGVDIQGCRSWCW